MEEGTEGQVESDRARDTLSKVAKEEALKSWPEADRLLASIRRQKLRSGLISQHDYEKQIDSQIRERDGSDPRDTLSPELLECLRYLAVDRNILRAAAHSGVHYTRIRNLLKTPRFQRALLLEQAKPLPSRTPTLREDSEEDR